MTAPAQMRPATFLHNVVAHPLLWLWPRAGRWLHERTKPVKGSDPLADYEVARRPEPNRYDAEDCEACDADGESCLYHEGVGHGMAELARLVSECLDDPEWMFHAVAARDERRKTACRLARAAAREPDTEP